MVNEHPRPGTIVVISAPSSVAPARTRAGVSLPRLLIITESFNEQLVPRLFLPETLQNGPNTAKLDEALPKGATQCNKHDAKATVLASNRTKGAHIHFS